MAVTAFDTLQYARQLKKAGMSDELAEAQADALAEALKASIQELSTKSDLAEMQSATKSDLAELRHDLQTQINKLDAKFDSKFDRLDSKIDKLDSKIDRVETGLRGELMLIKWMFTATFTGVAALIVRSFFFRVP